MVGVNLMKLPFSRDGRRSKVIGMSNKPSVNEEYKQAFRTNSYIEMFNRLQVQLRRTSYDRLSTTSFPPHSQAHLCDCLLAPTQKTLIDVAERLGLHEILVAYFQTSGEACRICETLLKSIQQTRLNYRKIRRVTKMSKLVFNGPPGYTDEQFDLIFTELEGISLLKNPLQMIRPAQFQVVHDTNTVLLRKLTSKQKSIRRKAKVGRLFKKVVGSVLVVAHIAIVTALLVLAFHSMIGVATAPALVGCSCSLLMKKPKYETGIKTSLLERSSKQLDVAAKGTFILINDFDTISRQLWRLCDEIEHCKEIAHMCVRNRKSEVLKELVKELQIYEDSFLEQLEDLEEHAYLCFHTINRSRRLVMQEILHDNDITIVDKGST